MSDQDLIDQANQVTPYFKMAVHICIQSDHTYLEDQDTEKNVEAIENLVSQASNPHSISPATVCVRPDEISRVNDLAVNGAALPPRSFNFATVVNFPNPKSLVVDARELYQGGLNLLEAVDEIDYVVYTDQIIRHRGEGGCRINIGSPKAEAEMAVGAAINNGLKVKAILRTTALRELPNFSQVIEEVALGALQGGVDFIVTSTGFPIRDAGPVDVADLSDVPPMMRAIQRDWDARLKEDPDAKPKGIKITGPETMEEVAPYVALISAMMDSKCTGYSGSPNFVRFGGGDLFINARTFIREYDSEKGDFGGPAVQPNHGERGR